MRALIGIGLKQSIHCAEHAKWTGRIGRLGLANSSGPDSSRNWYRLVALQRIAKVWSHEHARFARIESDQALTLVDDQFEHRRIVKLSLGLPAQEISVAEPFAIDWAQHAPKLQQWGIEFDA